MINFECLYEISFYQNIDSILFSKYYKNEYIICIFCIFLHITYSYVFLHIFTYLNFPQILEPPRSTNYIFVTHHPIYGIFSHIF